MKNINLIWIPCALIALAMILVATGPAVVAVSPVRAVLTDCDVNNTTIFDGDVNSSWTEGGNWSFGVPDSSLCAVIPANDGEDKHFNVVIPGSTTASCKTLTIGNEGDDKSTLFLTGGSTLILGDGGALTSTIDGQFDLSVAPTTPATLKINGDHTIQGNGGVIVLVKGSVIEEYTDADDKLTLKATSTCSSQSCGMTLKGDGYLKVNFDNRAYVIAMSTSAWRTGPRPGPPTAGGSSTTWACSPCPRWSRGRAPGTSSPTAMTTASRCRRTPAA